MRAAARKKVSSRSTGGPRPAPRPGSRGTRAPKNAPREPPHETAHAAPSVLEALQEIRSLVVPLADTVRGLEQLAVALESTGRSLAAAIAAVNGAEPETGREVGLRIEAAQEAITAALVSLPRAEDYAPAAAQLRELATVSPSLMEWLTEVPRLSTPLAGSVRGLLQAAAELEAAREALRARR